MSIRGKSFEGQKSLTQQQFRKRQDINTIVGNVRKGAILQRDAKPLVFGDASYVEELDVHKIFEITNRLKQSFMNLPPKVRERFENKPQKFVDFMESKEEKDIEEQYSLGLRIRKPEDPKAEPVEVIVKTPAKKEPQTAE